MRTYRASLPRGYGSVRQARRALAAFASDCGFRDTSLADVESAAGEALANAAEHGASASSLGFEVSATFDGRRLIIDVRDFGVGFESAERGKTRPDATAPRGFGLFLMRTLMDEVVFSDRGSHVHMVKRLSAR